ncbi:MAG TPA: dihydropyrimidinase [Clostridiales bacterium]|nr:dihydropyrimidinase [Clostridiales bacterium]
MKYLLKGGTVVSGTDVRKADVLIEDEKIVAVSDDMIQDDAALIDVTGKLLFPGFIDAHTHFDLEVSGTVTADNFDTGTKAAIAGGTTCIIDFATQNKGETLQEGLANWHKKADGRSSCDYGFHMAISEWTPQVSDEIPEMFEAGITSFKMYMTYSSRVRDWEIYQILKRIKEYGGVAGVHCENGELIDELIKEQKKAGNLSPSAHPVSRPSSIEAEAVNRFLTIAKLVDVPVIVVHLSSKEGFREIEQARENGQRVYVETCPQYLLMDEGRYYLPGFESAKYVISPPLRTKADNECLWKALKEEQIDTVATDHCSFTTGQKEMGKDDFTKIPNGMPGVETRAVLMYTFGVLEDRISLTQMCKLMAENPAKLYGMYPQKGCLEPGSDADLVIWDPNYESRITAKDQLQNMDYAPFEGLSVKGRAEKVFLRGVLSVEDGKVIKENHGKYISRKRGNLD